MTRRPGAHSRQPRAGARQNFAQVSQSVSQLFHGPAPRSPAPPAFCIAMTIRASRHAATVREVRAPPPPEPRGPGPRAALPTQSRPTHGASIQKRQLRGAKAARDETSHACRSLRSAPNPDLPERGRSGGLTPPPQAPRSRAETSATSAERRRTRPGSEKGDPFWESRQLSLHVHQQSPIQTVTSRMSE